MTVEAEYYSYARKIRRRKGETYHGSMTISPGSNQVITHLKPVQLLAIVDVSDSKLKLFFKNNATPGNPTRNLVIRKYENEEDEKGIIVDPSESGTVEMVRGQEMEITKKSRKKSREVFIYFDDPDDAEEGALDPNTRVPVLA